ncbi:hypothetical protein NC651_028775 [Populus alba x Populus x berolinensis]|nr:hypothetical protein NC651_028775 [Populus alba x Populus x berolinensis]
MKIEKDGIKCEKDYQEDSSSKDDEDYISSEKEEFGFLNANKDEWIDSLQEDACFGQILDGKETFSGSDEGDENESKRNLK